MTTAVEKAPLSDESSAGSLPLRKRKPEQDKNQSSSKIPKTEESNRGFRPIKRGPISKAREIRLEQNRKAARESRRRKKVMIEELQRSVIFFSRANGTLKQQNDELTRLYMQAQAQVAIIENQQKASVPQEQAPKAEGEQSSQQQGNFQQSQANVIATQAMYETQGYSAAAARAAAQTMSGSNRGESQQAQQAPAAAPTPGLGSLPPMQPGATMQAMANFQQAAAAAMQAAVQGMQGIPGLSLHALASAPVGSNAQQAYNDTMTALAMQHAAVAAAAGQQFFQANPFLTPGAHHMIAWQQQQHQQQQQAAQAQAAQATAEQNS